MKAPMIKSRYQPYQMRHKVSFNKVQEVETPIGDVVEKNVFWFSKHCAKVKVSLNQKFNVAGTKAEHDVYIAVRHDKRLDTDYQYLTATMNGVDYRIIDIDSVDDNYLSYDMFTLRKVDGRNGTR